MTAFGSAPEALKPAARQPGFFGWLRSLFAGSAKPVTAAPKPVAATVEETEEDPSSYVTAPGGYRIRIPNKDKDVDHTASEAIPAVQDALATVPPLPHVVVELLKEVQSATSTSSSLAEIAGTDPALAAALLRTVNSSAFSLNRKVTSVADAISFLGFGAVRSIVLKLRLDQALPRGNAKAAADAQDIWVHCLAVSYIADCLARRVPGVDAGLASTLGLLHDIGKLAMVAQLRDKAPQILPGDEPIRVREARAYGTDHAGLGANLAHRWKLPADLVNAIRWHHQPENAFEPTDPPALRKASFLVQIANELAKYAYPYSDDMELDAGVEVAMKELALGSSITKLMDPPVRAAITRAILSGWENTDSKQPLPRRFIRIHRGQAAKNLAAAGSSHGRILVDDASCNAQFSDAAHTINLASTHVIPKTAEAIRFIAPATTSGIETLTIAAIAHQQSLNLSPQSRGPAAFTLRSLLANLLDAPDAAASIEIVQSAENNRITFAIRSSSLGFNARLGSSAQGPQLVEAELANVLNLDWFASITISSDGSTWIFSGK